VETLHWGLLSTARINRAVIPPIRASGRSTLIAVASRTQSTADSYAQKWDIPRAYGAYEALIDDPDINAVYVSVPNHLHAEWSIKCAAAGKHVLCEKPLALTTSDVDRMIAAAREHHVVIAEAFMYRHHPQTLKVLELLNRRAIGDILIVKGTFTFRLARPDDARWSPGMGGGSIWDIGCYPISFTRLIANAEPVEVLGWQVLGSSGVDEVFAGQMRFATGLLAQFESGFRAPFRTGLEIVGTSGSITLKYPFKPVGDNVIEIRRDEGVESIESQGQELYRGEIEDMENAVLDSKPQRISLQDSRANVALIKALVESAQTGAIVKMK
jgi:predicted dehydrogenase